MIAFAVLILVNAYILMKTGTTQAVAPGERGGLFSGPWGVVGLGNSLNI